MKIAEVKQIIGETVLSDGTKRVLDVILEGDEERELTTKEVRQVVALLETETASAREEAASIDDQALQLKNVVSAIDNAAEMLEDDLKSLE